jgi:hypothetical protein
MDPAGRDAHLSSKTEAEAIRKTRAAIPEHASRVNLPQEHLSSRIVSGADCLNTRLTITAGLAILSIMAGEHALFPFTACIETTAKPQGQIVCQTCNVSCLF